MRLHFTLGYHPEGDGQTEHANQVLEQYLQVYMNYQQDDWVTLLPMAEFAYNNATNVTTGVSPFFANKGYHPEFTADLQVETSSAKVQAFVVDLECVQVELKENIAQAQERYWKNADKHRMEAPKLKIGDQAYIKAKFFRTRQPSKKLSEKNLGPYDVIGKPGTQSPSISHASSALSTWSFMYHNWNPHDPTCSLSNNSCHHHCYRLTENQNMRSARFWILKWTDAADWTIDYKTWYVGQVMKVLTRKLHGYQHETSPIHPNSTSYSTNDTPISQPPRIAETESHTTCRITARPPTSFFLPSFFLFFSLLSSFF